MNKITEVKGLGSLINLSTLIFSGNQFLFSEKKITMEKPQEIVKYCKAKDLLTKKKY